MSVLKTIEACECGIILNGVDYKFIGVNTITVDDPETTGLIRGADAKDTVGLSYTEGLDQPKTMTVNLRNIPLDLSNALKAARRAKTRMDFYCIERASLESTTLKDAIIQKDPLQLEISNTPDSLAMDLVFSGFNLEVKQTA